MRRLARDLLNTLTLLSLLLCVVATSFFIRGTWRLDGAGRYNGGGNFYSVILSHRYLKVSDYTGDFVPYPAEGWSFSSRPLTEDDSHPTRWLERSYRSKTTLVDRYPLGIGLVRQYNQYSFILIIPLWIPIALTALLPATRYFRALHRRRRRITPGLCPRCQYDLRATPERCPECGHTPA